MEPLSHQKRKIYFYGLIALFFVLIPILILYASGFRLTKNWKILETGGIYIFATEPNSEIYLNGMLERETNFYGKGVFIQNLKPGHYSVQVSKQGFYPWSKDVDVKENLVAEEHALLVPLNPKILTPVGKEKPEALKLFEEIFLSATSTEKDIELSSGSGELRLKWLEEKNSPPSFFCMPVCQNSVVIWKNKAPITAFDFYPGRNDAVIFVYENAIYAMQFDGRQNAHSIYQGKAALDFRLDGKVLFIKEGSDLFYLEL